MFPDDGNGSRIMLTTRLSDVARYADSSGLVREMSLMDDDQSWDLLRQKLFKQDPCPVDLEDVGKKIARSCTGLPLAVVVIAGILSTVDRTETAWKDISENVKAAISASDEQIDKILSLSYTHLPHHLRPCFLYMGGFPEDYEMPVSKLIKLWVAEGFLKPNGCNKSMEVTAEEYLEDLVSRSLVLFTQRKSDGRIKSVTIHDLMREMCRRNAEENFFMHVGGFLQRGMKIPRRVGVTTGYDLDFIDNNFSSTIRTIIHLSYEEWDTLRPLGYFRWLRILDLAGTTELYFSGKSVSLPDAVFELFHLRYLALAGPFRIPAAISNLQNLQTLIFRLSKWGYDPVEDHFARLPLEIWRMSQLRHLVFDSVFLPFQEGATVALENLQTLSVARSFVCSRKILEMIPNLKKLGISLRRRPFDGAEIYDEDCQLHNLIHLQQLENLKLKKEGYYSHNCPALPSTLKKLTLAGTRLPWTDMKIVGSLPNLEVLKLRDYAFVGDTWETTEGEFPRLKFLLIKASKLQHWITESSHFPRLVRLVLRGFDWLRVIPDEIREIPTLELIEVEPALVFSARQIQVYQRRCGNDALQVRCIR